MTSSSMSTTSHYQHQVTGFGFHQGSTTQTVKPLVLLVTLSVEHTHRIDQKVADTMADTVAVSLFYLSEQLV